MSHEGKMRRGEKFLLHDGKLPVNRQSDVDYYKEHSPTTVSIGEEAIKKAKPKKEI